MVVRLTIFDTKGMMDVGNFYKENVMTAHHPITSTASEIALRQALVHYIAQQHAGQAIGLAKDLECSLSLVTRYLHADRHISGSFINLVRQKLPGFNMVCNDALEELSQKRWLGSNEVVEETQ
jgi:hypothetical protein